MNLHKLTKNELIIKCKELNLKNYSSKSKLELIDMIINSNLENKEHKILDDIDNNIDINIDNNIDNNIINNEDILKINVNIEINNEDGIIYLKSIQDYSIDLILTDPPYIISKNSGMNEHYNNIQNNKENNIEFIKNEEEWNNYKLENDIIDDNNKDNYLKYGTIFGKKYGIKTDYGDWDKDFTIEKLDIFIGEYYKKLKKNGTIIIFFDLWKITILKELLEKHKFKQIRFIEWIKTNPQPRNSKVNYLTNCREIALLGVKDSNPTFNSKYDNGIYNFPLQGGKNRFHPTQKNLALFEELIKKHSNENDTVLDTFLGSGTTAIASKNTNRNFKGCEISTDYYNKIKELV